MILSMTGLGLAQADAGQFRGSVLVRSVNHRFLDLTLKLSRGLLPLETPVRELIQSRLHRGRVEVSVRGELGEGTAEVNVSRPLARATIAALRSLAAENGLADDLSLGDIAQIPGILELGEEVRAPEEHLRDAVLAVVGQALDRLQAMRQAEGERLAAVVCGHLETIARVVAEISRAAETGRSQRRDEIVTRARELTETLGLDDARLYQEIARLVERADICEELNRLDAHVAQARDALGATGPCGKALDFLAQEMMREANTIGSKAGAADVLHDVIGLKGEIERFREQVQNIE